MSKKYPVRRKIERIRLQQPIPARLGASPANLVDLSLVGCRAEHEYTLSVGASLKMHLRIGNEVLQVPTIVVRSRLERFSPSGRIYHSGLRFQQPLGEVEHSLRRIVAAFVERALDEQVANANAELPRYLRTLLRQGTTAELLAQQRNLAQWVGGFLCYSLEGSRWSIRPTEKGEQPDEGFTVWSYEDTDELELLCQTYEKSGDEVRRLIRICAAMSLLVDDSMPARNYQP